MEYAAIAVMVLLLIWLGLSDLGLPAAPWFERHRAVRPALLCVVVVLLVALLVVVASRLW
jgi:hypothetical protein